MGKEGAARTPLGSIQVVFVCKGAGESWQSSELKQLSDLSANHRRSWKPFTD